MSQRDVICVTSDYANAGYLQGNKRQRRDRAMADDVKRSHLAVVLEEMDAIHLANMKYWERKKHDRKEKMEYERRLERLEQIRKECGWTDSPCATCMKN
jgi:hypothetical protein